MATATQDASEVMFTQAARAMRAMSQDHWAIV